METFAAEETAELPKGETSAYERLQQEALAIERRTILELRNEHVISDEVMRRIEHDLDLVEGRSGQAGG